MTTPVLRRIQVDGVGLAVRDHAGGDPAILALHGLASNARWWDLVALAVGGRHRIVAIDLRGHGLSDRPAGGYDLARVARDARGVVEALALADPVVAGHSWGAAVALQYAATYPGEVRAALCVEGGLGNLHTVFGDTWEEARAAMTPPVITGLRSETVREWITGSVLQAGSDPTVATEIVLANFEDVGDGTLRPRLSLDRHLVIAEQLWRLDATALATSVRAPLLLVLGSDPQWRGPRELAAADLTRQRSGRTEVAWIEGGHDLPLECPTEVTAAFESFLDSLTQA